MQILGIGSLLAVIVISPRWCTMVHVGAAWCRLVQLIWSRSRIVAHLLRTQNAATRARQKGYKSRKEPKMTDVKI